MISSWSLFANGEPWDLLNGGAITYYGARIFQTNRAFLTEGGPIEARILGLTLSRHIGGGMHEDIDISNNSGRAVRFNLEIALRGDFADIFEVKSGRIVRRGHITTSWNEVDQQWRLTYRNRDFSREVLITAEATGDKGLYANGRISFDISLNPAETWHCCLLYDLFDGQTKHASPRHCIAESRASEHAESLEAWQHAVLKIRTSNEKFYRCFTQGVADMAALRLPINGTGQMVFIPAAGLPWFVALFGRDSLIVSLQTALVYPDFARGALDVLGANQAQERDDYRDAEHGSAAGRRQMRNEVVVDVRVIRKSVQQHKSRPAARKVPDIKASASVPHPVLRESWKDRALGVRHDLVPLILNLGNRAV